MGLDTHLSVALRRQPGDSALKWGGGPADNLWPSRLALVATLIPPHSSVLDIGAGARGLAAYLPAGCSYHPLDLPDFNMDTGPWPDGAYDVAVLAGVLEYSSRPGAVLKHLRMVATRTIITYAHHFSRLHGTLTETEFLRLARAAGFSAETVAMWPRPRFHNVWLLT